MLAKIYQPAASAMTSGRAHIGIWVLEFPPKTVREFDPLTGTMRGTDMQKQIDLKFDSLEDAVAYAKKNNIAHRVIKPRLVKRIPRSYGDNFSYERKLPWTH